MISKAKQIINPSSGATLEGAPFVVKTFQILEEQQNRTYITWSESGNSFIVLNPIDFASVVLPRYFKHNNFCSFIRQLNTYGFQKVEDTNNWEFKHDLFQRTKPESLKDILRRKSKKRDGNGAAEDDEPVILPGTGGGSQNMPGNLVNNTTPTQQQQQERQQQQQQQLLLPANQSLKMSNNGMGVGSLSPSLSPSPSHSHSPSPSVSASSPFQKPNQFSMGQNEMNEMEKLKTVNHLLTKEVIKLQQQQDRMNLVIEKMIHEMATNKKEIVKLHEQLSLLTMTSSGVIVPPSLSLESKFDLYSRNPSSSSPLASSSTPNTFPGSEGSFESATPLTEEELLKMFRNEEPLPLWDQF